MLDVKIRLEINDTPSKEALPVPVVTANPSQNLNPRRRRVLLVAFLCLVVSNAFFNVQTLDYHFFSKDHPKHKHHHKKPLFGKAAEKLFL